MAKQRTIQQEAIRIADVTPERLAQSEGQDIEIVGSKYDRERIVRLNSSPLHRMFTRGVIDKREFQAGERFYAHWYLSGLSPISAHDPGGVHAPFDPWSSSGMPRSERQALHREHYREAMKAMGKEISGVVVSIVLEEADPAKVGKQRFNREHEAQARASATDHCITGLRMMASHWGM